MAKDYHQLWKGVTDATDKAEAIRALVEIVADKEGRKFAFHLKAEDAVLCIEGLDYGITECNLATAERNNFFLMRRRLTERHERLPDRMIITGDMVVSAKIVAAGGFGDIRTGTYMGGPVAVKTARVAARDDLKKIRKQFYQEVLLWETLSHPNVLKLVGVRADMDKGEFITVSEWMVHGNIMQFIAKNSTNRLELLHGTAQGLKYLHGLSLTHGDLKGANILMSNDTPPRACLADFGFTTTVLAPGQQNSCSVQTEGCTTIFLSPELLMPPMSGQEVLTPTPQADIYAFGLVIFQVLTGETPFRGIPQSALAFSVVLHGKRPEKPGDASDIGFSDSLWDFTQRCWDGEAKSRPKVEEVVTHLGKAAANWVGLMPPHVRAESVTPDSEPNSVDLDALFTPPPSAIPTEADPHSDAPLPQPLQTKRKSKMHRFLVILGVRH